MASVTISYRWLRRAFIPLGLTYFVAKYCPAASDGGTLDEAYTITSIMQVLPPANPADMHDEFQDVRVISQTSSFYTLEISLHPFRQVAITGTFDWRRNRPALAHYLEPTPSENWDRAMRKELLRQLGDAGIDVALLTDKEVVEQVTRWALRRATTTKAFIIWTLHYPDRRPEVFPYLSKSFEEEVQSQRLAPSTAIAHEALGRSMYYDGVHGSCTSVAIYLSTILRAIGIPTRVVLCIPPFDPNDENQASAFYAGVHDERVRSAVKSGLRRSEGFLNHVLNEVYVGDHWVRLNYARLGQPILEPTQLGLMIHIATFDSISHAPLAETWGMRYFNYPVGQPRMSSINPYRLISIYDNVERAGRSHPFVDAMVTGR